LLPDVPSIAEALPGFSVDTWWGLVAPAQTPASVIQKLNQAFVQALQALETKARFANLMAEPVPSSPEAFGLFMRTELVKYEAVVKRSGAKVD
jgi:tripartite-type tricarboxylate transporter receptor subunit TctC